MTTTPRPNPPPAASLVGAETQLIWHDPYDPAARREWIKLALLLLVTAAAYLPALSAGFLWRDDQTITANEAIRSIRTLTHEWPHPRSVLLYRPVADTILWAEHAIWRDWNTSGYHLISLALHLLNTMLIWLLMRRLTLPGALTGAALFALHPVAVHAVGWAAQQPVLIATTFSLLAMLAWLRSSGIDPPLPEIEGAWNLSHRKWLLGALTSVLLLAALLADAATACAVPVVMYLIAWWKYAAAKSVAPLIALSLLVTGFVTWAHLSQVPTDVQRGLAPIAIAGRTICLHFFRLLVPHPLLLAYSTGDNVAAWHWIYPLIVIAAAAALVLARNRLGRGVVAAALAYVALLLPPVLLSDVMVDPQQYLARATLLIMAAAALVPLLPEPDEEGRHRATRPLAAVAVVAALGGLTWWQAEKCRDSRTAWSYALAHDPDSRIAHFELGNLLIASGTRGSAIKAIEQFRMLVARAPNDAEARLRLGEILLNRGEIAEASDQFRHAASLRPNDPAAWRHLAAAARRNGDLPAAVEHYNKALALDPHDDMARNNLAGLYVQLSQPQRALDEFERALKDNPRSAAAHVNLARLLFSQGRLDESAQHLQEAVKIDPDNYDAYMTAGDVLLRLNDPRQASRMFRAAIHIRRDSAEAFNLLGVSQAAQGQYSEAIYNFGRATDLDPAFAPAKKNLAAAQAQRDAGDGRSPATTRSTN